MYVSDIATCVRLLYTLAVVSHAFISKDFTSQALLLNILRNSLQLLLLSPKISKNLLQEISEKVFYRFYHLKSWSTEKKSKYPGYFCTISDPSCQNVSVSSLYTNSDVFDVWTEVDMQRLIHNVSHKVSSNQAAKRKATIFQIVSNPNHAESWTHHKLRTMPCVKAWL